MSEGESSGAAARRPFPLLALLPLVLPALATYSRYRGGGVPYAFGAMLGGTVVLGAIAYGIFCFCGRRTWGAWVGAILVSLFWLAASGTRTAHLREARTALEAALAAKSDALKPEFDKFFPSLLSWTRSGATKDDLDRECKHLESLQEKVKDLLQLLEGGHGLQAELEARHVQYSDIQQELARYLRDPDYVMVLQMTRELRVVLGAKADLLRGLSGNFGRWHASQEGELTYGADLPEVTRKGIADAKVRLERAMDALVELDDKRKALQQSR